MGTGLTGCLGDGTTDDEDEGFVAQVSFPVVHDFAKNVVPEGAEANNLVPVGQHGHGWEPSPDVQRAVTTSDAFVYVFEGFQPWADDMVTNLKRDHPGIDIIAAGKDVDMLGVDHNQNGGHDGDEGHDHEEGNVNPHFWLDPVRAKTAVDNVADGLTAADDADGYAENAESYRSRLDDLHEEFESSLSSASKETVLVAGHNAFAYLGERYGFRVETLTGVAPDEQPSPQDIQRAQNLIDSEGINYVLSPVFESDAAAQSLVEDTTASEALPITAFASFSQEWIDKDWGYIEVMRNVNLSSLKKALEA